MSLDISTPPAAPTASAAAPTAPGLDEILGLARQRRRRSLIAAAVALTAFMVFIVLTTSTTVLSGTVAGLGAAYWVGFAFFGVTLVVAQIYIRWARRMDVVVDAYLAGLDEGKQPWH